jgi:hypothetical protein
MSVEEMVKALEGEREFGDVWVDDDKAKAIVAALKAGLLLRAVCDDDMEEALRTEGYSLSADEVNNARRAWDNATEEDIWKQV